MSISHTLESFSELAKNHTTIPVFREVLADDETPISMARRQADTDRFFLLESVEGGENWGRYSILGLNIEKELIVDNGEAAVVQNGSKTALPGNPIDAIQSYLTKFEIAKIDGLPRFFGGLVGYFAYEAVRYFERCGTQSNKMKSTFREAHFLVADNLAVFDNVKKSIKLICCCHLDEHASVTDAFMHAERSLDDIERCLFGRGDTRCQSSAAKCAEVDDCEMKMISNVTREKYESMVAKAKDYISDGDIIQVVLAQHFSTEIEIDSLSIYRALRFINPSPYLYYLKLSQSRAIAGSSPEVMVRLTENKAEIRPIAGTRPRGNNHDEDRKLAEELLADEKERAEHVMLVDLARNDLGRVADLGSVSVVDYMFIEKYSHVMHLVSQVEATVRDEVDAIDVIKASFPAGTLSGAPKVRAMEIINELEPEERGPYGGALGYISYGGSVMDMAITIRTVVVDGTKVSVTAGAGIVYDSVPANEYMETIHKSNGMMRALELAKNGLKL